MSTNTKNRTEVSEGRGVPGELAVEQLPAELHERLGDELIDELLAGARTEEEIVGSLLPLRTS